MRKAGILGCVVLALTLGGCTSTPGRSSVSSYFQDRVLDFVDIFGIKFLAGKGMKIGIEFGNSYMATEYEDFFLSPIIPGLRRHLLPPNPILGYYDFEKFGFQSRAAGIWRDKGFDIPGRTDYVTALRPLLNAVGMDPRLTVILFTLDETSYSRELAPLAGVWPCLRLGPPWWFHDSAEGMRRFREMTTETAGFYNTVGFNDDTRAFCSIPARHDVARRVDCSYLATLVATGRLAEDEAPEVARDLTYGLAKRAYKL